MGEVYLAIRRGPSGFQKRVALKLLLSGANDDPTSMAMFLDEARLASQLDHPHIIPVIDFGQLNGRYFMAMPLIEGVSLHQFTRALGRQNEVVSMPMFRLIARGLCDGLGFAHRAKDDEGNPLHLVHRDVSPTNLMVSTNGGVFVADFGIAKAIVNEHHTRTGQVRGKFAYMAPEQMLGMPVDARSDVFSAAVTLYELLTGRNPFKRETEAATIQALQTDEVRPPSALRPEVSAALDHALLKGMARKPDDRFESMEALRDALLLGPLAQPHELGAAVVRACPEHLAKLTQQTPVPDADLTALRAPLPVTLRGQANQRNMTSVVVGIALGVALSVVALIALGLYVSTHQPLPPTQPVVPPQPVVVQPPPEVPKPPESTAVEAVDAGPAAVTAPNPPPEKSHTTGRGLVSFDATPWANISVDGKDLGATPVVRQTLASGTHDVTFQFSNGAVLNKRVQVQANRVLSVVGDGAALEVQVKTLKK